MTDGFLDVWVDFPSYRFIVFIPGRCCRTIDACLQNRCMQGYIENPELPFITEESVTKTRRCGSKYEQAIAFGGISETLEAIRSKS